MGIPAILWLADVKKEDYGEIGEKAATLLSFTMRDFLFLLVLS